MPDTGPPSPEKLAQFISAEKARAEDKYTEAILLFTKILEKDPDERGVRMVLADLQAKAGDLPGALQQYYQAGTEWHQEGHRDKVRDILERMRSLDPDRESIFSRKLHRQVHGNDDEPRPFVETLLGEGGDDVTISLQAPLFRDLDPPSRARLIERMAVLNVRNASIIFREGDPGTSLYVIGEGEIELHYRAPDGKSDQLFATLGPGEFFGEFAFLTGSARQFTARMKGDGKIFQLAKASLNELQESYPTITRTVSQFYRERVLERVLSGSRVFGSLPPGKRRRIAEKFQIERHGCGTPIIEQDSRGDALYLIRFGEVLVSARGPRGEEVFLTNLHPNDFFGEFSFLTGRPRSASVVATSDVELLTVSRQDIEPILEDSPEVVDVLKKSYFERMADNLHKISMAT